eukprot:TRINITY_DN6601_c0_g2_i1.p1 TRINITY_DN6601_c0_g2~~TRINITY_DN6601_c0_g2_i1.p1  ORF type:complete len:184 (-),score=17.56 TRINITY_DN6601_c0_g2_i1:137-688(-)
MFMNSAVFQRNLAAPADEILTLTGTGSRNEIFAQTAPKLAEISAKAALSEWGGNLSEISHVIHVSCTGTVVPGIEFHLMDSLGIPRSVQRFSLNFMGCFGGLAGIRMAETICRANSKNRVLLVCTELCSLHIQKDDLRFDNLVGTALFGDGSAALVMGSRGKLVENSENRIFEVLRTSCYGIP